MAAANMSTANGGTVLTVPANTMWIGCVHLSATLTVAIGGPAGSGFPQVSVSGQAMDKNNGDVVCAVALACPAVSITGLIGAQTTSSVSTGEMTVRAGATPVSLVLSYGSGVTAVAVACGEMRV